MFQFPSNGKAETKVVYFCNIWTMESFNSLQTGKHIQRYSMLMTAPPLMRFNSLQTGKQRQSSTSGKILAPLRWFQFPSNGKAYPKTLHTSLTMYDMSRFQFPSNGKAQTKAIQMEMRRIARLKVSIPFKRESTDKGTLIPRSFISLRVSIPFKRESTDKANRVCCVYLLKYTLNPEKRQTNISHQKAHVSENEANRFRQRAGVTC